MQRPCVGSGPGGTRNKGCSTGARRGGWGQNRTQTFLLLLTCRDPHYREERQRTGVLDADQYGISLLCALRKMPCAQHIHLLIGQAILKDRSKSL